MLPAVTQLELKFVLLRAVNVLDALVALGALLVPLLASPALDVSGDLLDCPVAVISVVAWAEHLVEFL